LKKKNDFFGKEHKIELYQNQLMLSTSSAIYSFGVNYYPFSKSLKKIKKEIPFVNSFLLLGTGLGSALKILQDNYQCYPKSTLVDFNQTLLDLSKELMELNAKQNVEWVCQEASFYIEQHLGQYDLIGIDIFVDMSVPLFVKSSEFISKIKKRLTPQGIALINLTFTSSNEQLIVENRLKTTFNHVEPIKHNLNYFYICKN
jgi:spermidine synthase